LLRDAILTHPTLVEGLIPLFLSKPETISAQPPALENTSEQRDALRSKTAKAN